MTKKKTKPACVLDQPIPQSQWTKTREAERITYPDGVPNVISWKTAEVYKGQELKYRGMSKP